jgi:hypothetical protein
MKALVAFLSILIFIDFLSKDKKQNSFEKWILEHKKQYLSES